MLSPVFIRRLPALAGLFPKTSLPVVYPAFLGDPGGEADLKMGGQRLDVWLVHQAQLPQFPVGCIPLLQYLPASGQKEAQLRQLLWRQSVGVRLLRSGSEDQ